MVLYDVVMNEGRYCDKYRSYISHYKHTVCSLLPKSRHRVCFPGLDDRPLGSDPPSSRKWTLHCIVRFVTWRTGPFRNVEFISLALGVLNMDLFSVNWALKHNDNKDSSKDNMYIIYIEFNSCSNLENIWRTAQMMTNMRAKMMRIPTILGSTKRGFFLFVAGSSTRILSRLISSRVIPTFTGDWPPLPVTDSNEAFPRGGECGIRGSRPRLPYLHWQMLRSLLQWLLCWAASHWESAEQWLFSPRTSVVVPSVASTLFHSITISFLWPTWSLQRSNNNNFKSDPRARAPSELVWRMNVDPSIIKLFLSM